MPELIPTVEFDKPPLPTLWLDTSVAIKLAKINRGEALQEIEVQRGTRLKKLVFNLVRAGKLLCPETEQEDEYVAERLDEDVHAMFHSLSLGISMAPHQGILDAHIFAGMNAYAIGSPTINLPSSTYFSSDPIRRLARVRRQSFFVAPGPTRNPEWLQRRADSKAAIHRAWEQRRQQYVASRRSYKQQLEFEKKAEIKSIFALLRKFAVSLSAGTPDVWDLMGAEGAFLYRNYWDKLGVKPPGWEGLNSFFTSPYFSELPMPYISCRLAAELLTGNEAITSGDPKDVELLSVALPVAHFVVTDWRMELRVRKLHLDEKWRTEVYSMPTIDGLFRNLEKLM
jgi:hypothetical protein